MAAGLTIESEKIEELEKFFEKQLTNKVINIKIIKFYLLMTF